jgi:hypothetical protein
VPDSKPIIPEVLEADEAVPPDLLALRRFAFLMDEAVAIPGTRRRIGIDAAVGLIPGVGDVIGGLMSAWIVVAALRHRVPGRQILRMVFNILLDVLVGAIPFLGDIFDFLFEENVLNLNQLLKHRDRHNSPRNLREIGCAATAIVALIVLVSVASAACLVAAIIWIAGKR